MEASSGAQVVMGSPRELDSTADSGGFEGESASDLELKCGRIFRGFGDRQEKFRHDAGRSGTVQTTVQPTGLKRTWGTKLGGKLSTSVVAGGKLFVASIDTHTVYALDANTGERLWQLETTEHHAS